MVGRGSEVFYQTSRRGTPIDLLMLHAHCGITKKKYKENKIYIEKWHPATDWL